MLDMYRLPHTAPEKWPGKRHAYLYELSSEKRYHQGMPTQREYGELLENRLKIIDLLMQYAKYLNSHLKIKPVKCPTPPISWSNSLEDLLEKDKKHFSEAVQTEFWHEIKHDPEFMKGVVSCFGFSRDAFEGLNLFFGEGFLNLNYDVLAIFRYYAPKYIDEIKTQEQLDAFMGMYEWFMKFNITYVYNSYQEPKKINPSLFNEVFPEYCSETRRLLSVLGVESEETKLSHFDLKNSDDIKRCHELYPLAKKYPFLFVGWYTASGKIRFEPTYQNGLEKKRKEVHAELETKKAKAKSGIKRGILKVAAKAIVPEKLGKGAKKLEQKIADVAYREKRPGRR